MYRQSGNWILPKAKYVVVAAGACSDTDVAVVIVSGSSSRVFYVRGRTYYLRKDSVLNFPDIASKYCTVSMFVNVDL